MKKQKLLPLKIGQGVQVLNGDINKLLDEGWLVSESQPFMERNVILLEREVEK